jgi:hypothetical protein
MIRTTSVMLIALLACCTVSFSQTKSGATKIAGVLSGDAKGSAANNPVCQLFTKAEAGAYMGSAVTTFVNAGGGTGCQWNNDGDGWMMVNVVPARDFSAPSNVKGHKKLPELGSKGFVAPDFGWLAGSIAGTEGILVNLYSKTSTEAKTVELLKETIKRRTAKAK